MLPLLSANLLRALFIGLGSDALLFLAGIWSSESTSSASASERERVAHAALSHAVAFFAAHQGAPNTIDFQTIIPSLVAQLQSESKIVREAALECIVLVNKIAQASKPSSIYAMDEIYAAESGSFPVHILSPIDRLDDLLVKIQFIDWTDFGRYLGAIVIERDHFAGSEAYLLDFHARYLSKAKGEGKKEANYKQRTLCYLLSHVQACPLSGLRAALMKTLSRVSSSVKVELLHDLLGDIIKKEKSALEAIYGVQTESFVKDAVSCFDASMCSALRDSNGKEWTLFCRIVTRSFLPGTRLSLVFKDGAHVRSRLLLFCASAGHICS
jgi:U3 small nucleolar RNA-associated protein 10